MLARGGRRSAGSAEAIAEVDRGEHAHVAARTDLVATSPDDVVRTAGVKLVVAKPPVDIPVLPMNRLWHPRHTTHPRHRFMRETVAAAIRGRMGQ